MIFFYQLLFFVFPSCNYCCHPAHISHNYLDIRTYLWIFAFVILPNLDYSRVLSSRALDLTGMAETWWDSSPPQSAAMDGYQFFSKDGLRERRGTPALNIEEQQRKTQPLPRDR